MLRGRIRRVYTSDIRDELVSRCRRAASELFYPGLDIKGLPPFGGSDLRQATRNRWSRLNPQPPLGGRKPIPVRRFLEVDDPPNAQEVRGDGFGKHQRRAVRIEEKEEDGVHREGLLSERGENHCVEVLSTEIAPTSKTSSVSSICPTLIPMSRTSDGPGCDGFYTNESPSAVA